MYKNQLQELAQRSCFNLPSYACIREGPDHAPRFKATVNFNGETFESPSYFPTLRQAEHAAAEIALNTLAERVPSKSLVAEVLDETGVYKNLLQETAHRAGLNLPSYTTLRSGPGHTPVFSCTVDIAGMTFTGESAKTKKQAQKNAAMTAWSALKQMSQCSSSSSATSSVSHEEQEQVVVARFLASLNPAGSSNSSQNNRQKGPDRQSAPAPGRIFLRSTPTSFGTRRLDWQSYNIPPEVLSVMWYQEQLAQRQRPVMALPVPIPPVPPSTQVLPWMPSMLQPSHYPYCVTGEQPVPLTPGINMRTANSPYYFSNQVRPDPMTAGSMVTIQDRQEEILKDPSFHSPAVPPSAPPLPRTSSDPRLNERLKKEAEQQSIPQTAPLKARDKIPTVFDSARPANIRLSHATTSNYHGKPRPDFPTALRGVPAGPTQMQSGVGSFPARPRFGRMQEVGFPSAFTAPAVQIRSVVPVCSAAPSRKMPSTAQTGKSTDDSSNQSTDDVSIVGSSLGNLQL